MANTTVSDMQIYDTLMQTAYFERIQDVINLFNGQSQGAVTFASEVIPGDLKKEAIYVIGGSVSHRDVTSTSTVTPSKISSDEKISVKTPWKYGPYATTKEAFLRRARSVEEFSQLIGTDLGDAVMQYWTDAGIAAALGAIGTNATMTIAGDLATDGKKVLTQGLLTFGDRFNRIAVWIMNSENYFDLVDDAIDTKLYEEASAVVYGGTPGTLGKPVLVMDRMTRNKILGLQPGAIEIVESQPPVTLIYDIEDQENISIGYRGEGAFNVGVLGYSYDETAGGANPNTTSLADSDNWDQYATSDKATAGFIIDINYS